jgi:hypothetical protein
MPKGRAKGSKNRTTVWVLESLKKRGVDYEKMLADALKGAVAGDPFSLELLDRLIKLAPHIANKPKETVGMEGVEGLVVERYKEPEKKKPEA